jgi:glycosyltransferase involved in cell wall biosynthesis
MSPMRVLMVSKACVVGQYQVKLEELARQPDLELTVVVPPYWRDERGVIPLERVHTKGYTLLVEPMRFNGQFHLHYYPTLPEIIHSVQPNLVHIDEEPYNFASFLALRAARHEHAKTLFFTWQNILRRYPLPFSWIESYIFRHTDFAIAGNAEAVDVLRAKGYRGELSVIPQFGVDAELFSPANYPTTQLPNPPTTQPFCIGYAGGRLVQEKGIDVLLRAVAGLPGNWELRLLGSGPDKSRLQALARELEIDARVRFDPPIPSTKVTQYLRQLDLAVLPSLTRPNWKEQFGRVLIEAMACEVPVIGSNCGEIPKVIDDVGLIFPEGDVAALCAHIESLQHDPARRRELGQRGRARVLEHFTQAHIAAKTYAVYRLILEEPQNA